MEIIQVDELGHLFIAPDIDDWCPLSELGITAIPFSEELGGMGLGVLDMVIALDHASERVVKELAERSWNNATFFTASTFGEALRQFLVPH